jgi:hypothetical protein
MSSPVRPAPVTVTVHLLYLAALMQLVNGVAALATYHARLAGYTAAYSGTAMADQARQVTLPVISGAVLAILVAGLWVVLGVLVDRGNRIGRILTWVFGGLALCCSAAGAVAGEFSEGIYNSTNSNKTDGPSAQRVYSSIHAALPGWYAPVTTFIAFVAIAAVLLAIVLLALPSANPYFRRPEPVWEPPPAPEPHVATYDPPEHEESGPASGRHDPPAAAL